MSTKIYTGFQIATSSLTEVLEIVRAFRPEVERKSRLLMKRFIENASPSDHSKGWRQWLDVRKQTVLQGIRQHDVDTQFQIVLFPTGDRFLGIAYTEQPEWFQDWLKQPKVSEYAYWNSTDDTPEGVSYKDFVKRGDVWNQLLGNGIPAMNGFSIDITDPNGPQLWKLYEEEQAAIAAANNSPSP